MEPTYNVVVTGGYGLVGSAIQWAVQTQEDPMFGRQNGENWIFLSRADGDLRSEKKLRRMFVLEVLIPCRDYHAAEKIFEMYKPQKLIHLAAHVGGMFKNSEEPMTFLRDNLLIDQTVLRLAHIHKVSKVVSCLSTCIFPDETVYPINESMLHDGPPHESNYGYAYAKRMLEVSNRAYAKQYGCEFMSVIPTNIYGPNDNFDDGCHFLPSLIKRLYEAKRQDAKAVSLLGSGKAMRQFIYSRDIAKLIIWTLRHYKVDETAEISIEDVTKLAGSVAGFSGSIEWDLSASDGQLKKTADNGKLRKLLPDFEFTDIREGIQHTLAWYAEQRELADGSRTKIKQRL
ncbi:hypothetical protein OPT61_g6556 [Boeremia exigua]|uniref:Uncharacterized protein n=1 Tax=Boeremia exigua TaxID=749465 RepID=A0ACC2I5Z8_9PLEO|nr:hypothetical protein OPT61_g6556 [Boeremia exigua]